MLTGALAPVPNTATWTDQIELVDTETGEAVDISDASEIVLVVRDQVNQSVALQARLSDEEIVLTGDTVFEFEFTPSQMGALEPRTYDVGCTLTLNDQTIQVMIGTVAVLDGIVS